MKRKADFEEEEDVDAAKLGKRVRIDMPNQETGMCMISILFTVNDVSLDPATVGFMTYNGETILKLYYGVSPVYRYDGKCLLCYSSLVDLTNCTHIAAFIRDDAVDGGEPPVLVILKEDGISGWKRFYGIK